MTGGALVAMLMIEKYVWKSLELEAERVLVTGLRRLNMLEGRV